MPHYRVLLHGHNLWLALDGRVRHLGFYVTRFVQAASPVEAERRALREIIEEPYLRYAHNKAGDPPFVDVRESGAVAQEAVPAVAPGYALYLIDERDAA